MIIGIIPARWDSTRFPGKPMAEILGKPMIRWVYDAAVKSVCDYVSVVTDSWEVYEYTAAHGIITLMTGKHGSGTDRCRAAMKGTMAKDSDIIINIQGDEPCITPGAINQVADAMRYHDVATLCYPISADEALNPDVPKVVLDSKGYALYFSRCPIPINGPFRAHVGIYGYKYEVLKEFVEMGGSKLEACEDLEQLRFLEAGIGIKVIETGYRGVGVDRPADIPIAEACLAGRNAPSEESPS